MAPLNIKLLLIFRMLLPLIAEASNDAPNEIKTSVNRLVQSLDRLSDALQDKCKFFEFVNF